MATVTLIPQAQTNSEQITQEKPKTLNRFIGAILTFFGQALKVEAAEGHYNYVKISELKEKYVFCHLKDIKHSEVKLARNDKIINDLFLSTINPLRGQVVSKETLEKFSKKAFKHGLNYSSTEPKEIYSSLRKIRASIHSKEGMTTDQKKFIGNIQLGDIIFHRTDDTVHSDIVQIQGIANALGFECKHRDGVHHNHVYMCAKVDEFGKKWFAEAAWPSGKRDEIRLVSEDDVARCFLKQDHGAISEIFRCSDSDLAARASKEACDVTTQLMPENVDRDEDPTELRYTKMEGAKALFYPSSFGHIAKTRLYQWIRTTQNGGMPSVFKKPTDFFCSYLVGYAYQVAEGRPIVAELEKGKETSDEGGLINLIRAHVFAFRHRKYLEQEMQFSKFDAKRSTPGDLYSWVVENKQLFTSIQSYQQPNNGEHA